ncbi:MAG TPA: fatty acid desaturase, partial [Myxococcota bacterium]|nr:fatty acid desaturase [Myxococcota bacterium]
RKVPEGRFSGRVNDQELSGEEVEVQGPLGDFFLRPADAPILMVAGGSGLAPLLAMLREAEGVQRPVTLLFGARREADLYELEEIHALAARWKAPFLFVPVLSELPEGSLWAGERGLVTEKIVAFLQDGAHAYLCGPPAMVDRAESLLRERGILRSHIHADRFVAGPVHLQTATEGEQSPAGVADYLKFFLFHAIGLLSVLAILVGGGSVTVGLIGVVLAYVAGDALLGEDLSTPNYRRPGILTAQLWMALPLLALIVFSALWSVSSVDVVGFGAWLSGWSGFDFLAAREATAGVHHISTWILTGLMIGMVGTITAHELTHRTWDPISMAIGRWLLAFSFDTIFAIEHVYGHHRNVSTAEDPATAPRGRNVYTH